MLDVDVLLLDLDETILSHTVAQQHALDATLREHLGQGASDELVAIYTRHNTAHWKAYERGEVTQEQLRRRRWVTFLDETGIDADPAATDRFYVRALAADTTWMPGAEEALPQLAQSHRLAVVTNGFGDVAHPRLRGVGIDGLFEAVIVSDEIGVAKPQEGFFDAAFAALGEPARDRVAIVGDSLTSDMAGGRRYGITTVWVNPNGHGPGPHPTPDLVVTGLAELVDTLA